MNNSQKSEFQSSYGKKLIDYFTGQTDERPSQASQETVKSNHENAPTEKKSYFEERMEYLYNYFSEDDHSDTSTNSNRRKSYISKFKYVLTPEHDDEAEKSMNWVIRIKKKDGGASTISDTASMSSENSQPFRGFQEDINDICLNNNNDEPQKSILEDITNNPENSEENGTTKKILSLRDISQKNLGNLHKLTKIETTQSNNNNFEFKKPFEVPIKRNKTISKVKNDNRNSENISEMKKSKTGIQTNMANEKIFSSVLTNSNENVLEQSQKKTRDEKPSAKDSLFLSPTSIDDDITSEKSFSLLEYNQESTTPLLRRIPSQNSYQSCSDIIPDDFHLDDDDFIELKSEIAESLRFLDEVLPSTPKKRRCNSSNNKKIISDNDESLDYLDELLESPPIKQTRSRKRKIDLNDAIPAGSRKLRSKPRMEKKNPVEKLQNILIPLNDHTKTLNLNLRDKIVRNFAEIASLSWLESCLKCTTIQRCKLKRAEIFIDGNENIIYDDQQMIRRKRQKNYYIIKILNSENDLDSDTESIKSFYSSRSYVSNSQIRLREQISKFCNHESFIGDENPIRRLSNATVFQRIEDIFIKIYQAFEEGKIPTLVINNKSADNYIMKDNILQVKPFKEIKKRSLVFNSKKSQFNFCLIVYVMAKIYILLKNDTTLTKRELFYQIKTIIKSQQRLNNAIDDISSLLNVGQWNLHIICTSGLIYGDLIITYSSGTKIDCNVKEGTLIPTDIDDIVELKSNAYFILVVEKESIFQKLIQEDLPKKLARPFLMITGKGQPSLNCQRFLRKLWKTMNIPVFIMVDADPHGVRIMLNYKFTSMNNAHLSGQLAVPKARWLGILPSEILTHNIKSSPLTVRDKKLIENYLKSQYMQDNPNIKKELEYFLKQNKKASIEGLIKVDNYLSNTYLPNKLFSHKFI